MRFKRTGMLMKIVLLIAVVVAVTGLLNLRAQVDALQGVETDLAEQAARLRQQNEALSAAIRDGDDQSHMEDVARDTLGLVKPGEIVFYDSGN